MSSRKRHLAEIAVLVGGIVVAAVMVFVLSRDAPARAEVGDCVEQTGSDTVEVVACDDTAADFRVVARVENQTRNDATINACLRYQEQGVVSSFWQGDPKGTGYVLCLAKARS
jgi:hypothetical protein